MDGTIQMAASVSFGNLWMTRRNLNFSLNFFRNLYENGKVSVIMYTV